MLCFLTCLLLNTTSASPEPRELYENAIAKALRGEFELAKSDLETAVAKAPKNASINLALSLVNDVLTAGVSKPAANAVFASIDNGNKGNFGKAEAQAGDACSLAPDWAGAWIHLGTARVELVKAGKISSDKVVDAYRRAIAIDSTNGWAYLNLAIANAARMDWHQSKRNLRRATSLGMYVPPELQNEIDDHQRAFLHKVFLVGWRGVSFKMLLPDGAEYFNAQLDEIWGTEGEAGMFLGLLHGVTFPMRSFGVAGFRYAEYAKRTKRYWVALVAGGVVTGGTILLFTLGVVGGLRGKNERHDEAVRRESALHSDWRDREKKNEDLDSLLVPRIEEADLPETSSTATQEKSSE